MLTKEHATHLEDLAIRLDVLAEEVEKAGIRFEDLYSNMPEDLQDSTRAERIEGCAGEMSANFTSMSGDASSLRLLSKNIIAWVGEQA